MEDMFLVAGLGNPGQRYEKTRHNAGFLVVERVAERLGFVWAVESKFSAKTARGQVDGAMVLLVEPLTYMNESGRAVGQIAKFYKVPPERLLVVIDDADLELGMVRMRQRGSSGGHNGLKSISGALGTNDYARQKVGIGRQGKGALHGHVLGEFRSTELELLGLVLDRAADQIDLALKQGFEVAMNRFNGLIANE